jgi:hypothetical protein
MTARQEKFVRNVLSGMSQRQAYRDAYPNSRKWKDASVDNKASALARSGEVSARLKEGAKKASEKAILTRERKIEMLTKEALKAQRKGNLYGMIACIKVLNDMTGDNAPKKEDLSVDILPSLLARHRDALEDA